MATLQSLDAKLDRLIDAMVTQKEFVAFHEEVSDKFDSNNETARLLVKGIDGLKKSTDDLLMEYAAISIQLARHERWFKEIAKKTGVELRP